MGARQRHGARAADRWPGHGGIVHLFDENTGENAIIAVAGAAGLVGVEDVEAAADAITGARVFVTRLEQPAAAALRGLQIALQAGVITNFNPAPVAQFDEAIYPLVDYITPNEHEAALSTGLPATTLDEARAAGNVLLARGVGCALITLGERGALLHSRDASILIPAFNAGAVVETTGAGAAFNGGFAYALGEGATALDAARLGPAVAAISVTRSGSPLSMPRAEVDALMARDGPGR